MGSLAPSWDTTRPGKAPKGFEDFKEPISPRAFRCTTTPFDSAKDETRRSGDLDRKGSGPPSLARVSAPPMHGASAVQRYLSRASTGSAGSGPPVSPRVGTPRSAPKHLTLKLGDEEMNGQPISAKEKWYARVESSRLNERALEVEDEDSWRHGGFTIADPCHAMHLPGSPRAAMVAEPFTPPAAVAAVAADAEQRVTVTRVPQDALESFDSAAL